MRARWRIGELQMLCYSAQGPAKPCAIKPPSTGNVCPVM
jgi:hypothetical protein